MPGLFDKMKAAAGEKVLEASIRSKEALDAQHIKGKIGELQNHKKGALAELGVAVYAMCVNSTFDQAALTQQCDAIAAFDAQIKEKEAELEEVHQNAEMLLADQKQAEQQKAAAGAAAGSTFCPECGGKVEGAPKFCPSCGKKLG